MGSGRAHKKPGKVQYNGQDLKIINQIWNAVFGRTFRPDPKKPLDELVTIEIGRDNYVEAAKLARSEKYFNGASIFYIAKSKQLIEVPRNLRPLLILALYDANHSYSRVEDKVYIPPMENR